jgi:hypothetical protein
VNLFKQFGIYLSAAFLLSFSLISQANADTGRPERPQKKASEIFQDRSADPRDYDLGWSKIPVSEPQVFLPDMSCDLSKKYFELSARPGFKVPTPPEKNDFEKSPDGYDPKGIMPWPGILGHWQDWNTGVYLEIQRVQETDLDRNIFDYLVVRIYSMCTDELLSESATLIQNSNLNQSLKVPTIPYGLRLNAAQVILKVIRFEAIPQTDELEIELRHVDSFTKEPKRAPIRLYRFF